MVSTSFRVICRIIELFLVGVLPETCWCFVGNVIEVNVVFRSFTEGETCDGLLLSSANPSVLSWHFVKVHPMMKVKLYLFGGPSWNLVCHPWASLSRRVPCRWCCNRVASAPIIPACAHSLMVAVSSFCQASLDRDCEGSWLEKITFEADNILLKICAWQPADIIKKSELVCIFFFL